MNHFSCLLIVFQIIISIFNISIIYFGSSKEVYIDIDNQISEIEDNIDFSNFSAKTKLLALYLPKINYEEKNSNIIKTTGIFNQTNLEYNTNFSNIHQNELCKYYEYQQLNIEEFQNQINLVKSHGIYGLAIYYCWYNKKNLLEKPLELFLKNKSIDFNFMLILENKNLTFTTKIKKARESHVKKKFIEDLISKFIIEFKEYIQDKRYIRINHQPVLGLYTTNKKQNLHNIIKILRKKEAAYGTHVGKS